MFSKETSNFASNAMIVSENLGQTYFKCKICHIEFKFDFKCNIVRTILKLTSSAMIVNENVSQIYFRYNIF